MCKRIYVTLDTEMDSDIHWGRRYPATYSSILRGIPDLLRPLWNKYDVHPIYFVSPEVLYNEDCVEILKNEVKMGAIIGAHLHPEFIEPGSVFKEGMNFVSTQFPCSACSTEEEREKIGKLTELIYKKLGVKPIWYRAGRFGADINTIKILQEYGYKYDSSVTPYINWSSKGGPDHHIAPKGMYPISDSNMYNKGENLKEDSMYEYPVTILGKRFGILGKLLPDNWLCYMWLRPTHMTYMELKMVVKRMIREGLEEGVMMFHSTEIMIKKTPYVRNRWMQKYFLWRLDKILKYAIKKGYKL